jgi:predicted metal-dependent enzyme (double-stranded beta helix superfamily)
MRTDPIEHLVEACRASVAAGESPSVVRELVAAAIGDGGPIASTLREPEHGGVDTLYRSADLTVLHFTWPPWMCLKPHNHTMWAVIGIFAGREDNIFWRRAGSRIEAAGARSLGVGDVTVLGADVIHSVTNPIGKMTRAIHVYGGDFFAPPQPRSEWDAETLVERPWDMKETERLFVAAEARARTV